ncbi:MAG: hypothetical protein F4Y04_07400 [Chloroflexi bacterium]|nr:hypothetical protein [Chloroflexota bacterium]
MTRSGSTIFNPLAVAQQTSDTPLAGILADRIQRTGPISFAEWMDACLYHPVHGYYRRGKPTVGRDGDFLTSPEIHPIFGAAVGHAAMELWRQLGQPDRFEIAEVGPGTGALAESLLQHFHTTAPDLAAVTRYSLIEADPGTSHRQRERLRALLPPSQIDSIPHIDELAGGYHLVLANELLDALPVHRLTFRDGVWQEVYVQHSAANGFHEIAGEVSDQALLLPLQDVRPSENQIVEVAPERASIVRRLAHAVGDPGLLLLFDYGYSRERLYASWRRDGTLMTFRNHVPSDDPYGHPGEQDITAHVDIDQISDAVQASGLTPLPRLNQAEWLHRIGAAVLPAVADAEVDTSSYLAARRATETLADPAGLGRVAVMGFTQGPIGSLPGWTAP